MPRTEYKDYKDYPMYLGNVLIFWYLAIVSYILKRLFYCNTGSSIALAFFYFCLTYGDPFAGYGGALKKTMGINYEGNHYQLYILINYLQVNTIMRNYFLNFGFLVLALSSVSSHAEVLGKDAIPPQIMDQLYKRHPNAIDISAEKKTHFKQSLYEITFKEEKDKEKIIELYRDNGRFFINADNVTGSNMMPAVGYDNLKAAFDTYTIKDAILVVNPNGIGEEYDLTVNASGNDWSVIVDHTGNITQKERD